MKGWYLVFRNRAGSCVVVDASRELAEDLRDHVGPHPAVTDIGLRKPPSPGLWRWAGSVRWSDDGEHVKYTGDYTAALPWANVNELIASARQAFGALGAMAAPDSVQGRARRRLRKALEPFPLPDEDMIDREQVVYACGYEHEPGSFGMWAGPFPDLGRALEKVPEADGVNPRILRFDEDGNSAVIYRWNAKGREWTKVKE